QPGAAIDRLVSFVDFAPTVLSLAGLEIPEQMEGRAFLGSRAAGPREHVFAIRDRVDEVYEMSRAVRDKRFKYIRHYLPHRPMMQHSDYSERTPTRQEFRRLAAEGKLVGAPEAMVRPTKPAEELFDTRNDPHEIRNLANSPEHRSVLERMREAHRNWVVETHDTGLLQEAEMYRRCDGGAPYSMTHTPGKFAGERIFEAADLVGRGSGARAAQIDLLGDPDSAVRYWATVGLAALGGEAKPAVASLTPLLEDPSLTVRLGAAEALANVGHASKALPVIVEALQGDDGWARLQAAIVLVAIGENARPASAEMQEAAADSRKHQVTLYVRWALLHALANLGQ
ncbi:MAG: HEAT repeat domain-containing protein, partial [Planctomycetes bacterium]|nr:HEAT repeat domain-containing protein [Planctomycetota bacterium]